MIAIVGRACELPDARTPEQLWENVLAGRRAFRRLPSERLALADYLSLDRTAEDRMYATEAALHRGVRVRPRALPRARRDVSRVRPHALAGARRGVPRARRRWVRRRRGTATGVDRRRPRQHAHWGDVARGGSARALALRAARGRRRAERAGPRPPVRAASCSRASSAPTKRRLLRSVTSRSPAALSNTIAGRVCNHLDLGGGGYTVDGACAASLLAVITACQRLTSGELDVASPVASTSASTRSSSSASPRRRARRRRDARLRRPLAGLLAG